MPEYVVDVSLENAQKILIEESHQRPVVVDFWSPRSEPCQALMPILEGLAAQYAGQFLLAKVNAEELPQITGQFGISSLPTVMIIQNGQPVDGFQGAQAEPQVRELLEKYLPKPWDLLLAKATPMMEENQWPEALELVREAYDLSSGDAGIAKILAKVQLELNRCDDAELVLSKIKMAEQDVAYEQLVAMLELKRNAAKSPEIEALEQQLVQEPENTDLQLQLAVQYSQHNYPQDALELLLKMLRKDINCKDGAVKKTAFDIITTLGKSDPLAIKFQRQVFSLLY